MNFNSIIQNDFALERQIVSILNCNFKPFSSGKNYYNFRCNVCGDSLKHKSKRRGYILKKIDKPWHFFCHNCQVSMSVIKWMKEYFPLNYREYIKEILSNKKEPLIKHTVVKYINKENISEKEDIKFFIPILKGNGKLFEDTIKLCKDRLIPENVWEKWFIAIDGKYKNRLIIPFFDNKGKIYYWQGRALKDWMIPKYLSRLGDHFNNIYNYYIVDKSKEVICLEGPIDCEFIENSVALTGLKYHDDKIKVFKNPFFLFDDDKDGKKKTLKLLESGKYVFNWSKFKKDLNLPDREKWDINDTIIYLNKKNKFTFEELKPYFTNSIFDRVYFII